MQLKSTSELTAALVRELLSYDPDTGVITWKVRRNGLHGGVRPGDVAGHVCPVHGYISVGVHGLNVPGHRLAWLLMRDDPLPPQLDHRDGVRTNNKWANLRASCHGENQQNLAQRPSESGFRGVYRNGRNWSAVLQVAKVKLYMGTFEKPEDASQAYLKARAEHYGYQPIPREMLRAKA